MPDWGDLLTRVKNLLPKPPKRYNPFAPPDGEEDENYLPPDEMSDSEFWQRIEENRRALFPTSRPEDLPVTSPTRPDTVADFLGPRIERAMRPIVPFGAIPKQWKLPEQMPTDYETYQNQGGVMSFKDWRVYHRHEYETPETMKAAESFYELTALTPADVVMFGAKPAMALGKAGIRVAREAAPAVGRTLTEAAAGEAGAIGKVPKKLPALEEAANIAREKIAQRFAEAGDIGEIYITPQMRVEVAGKERLVNASEIVRGMGAEPGEQGLNYWKVPKKVPEVPVAKAPEAPVVKAPELPATLAEYKASPYWQKKQEEFTAKMKPYREKADVELKRIADEFMDVKKPLTEYNAESDAVNLALDKQADKIRAEMGFPKAKALPAEGVKVPEVAAVKEPWMMTQKEFIAEDEAAARQGYAGHPGLMPDFTRRRSGTIAGHRQLVEDALSEGKPISLEVLKDYPDLAAKAKPQPVVAESVKAQGAVPKAEIPTGAPKQPVSAPVSPAVPGEAVTPSLEPPVPPGRALPGKVPPVKPPAKVPPMAVGGRMPVPIQPPVPGSPLSRIQKMLQTPTRKSRDWRDIGLKAQEYLNDNYYGLRRMQGQAVKPIQPGTQRDIITAITDAPGAPNAGLTRYELTVAEMKKIAPDTNVTDISTILFSEHGKEVLAAKGAKRVLPGGVNTAKELDQALVELRTSLGEERYQKAYQAAEIVKRTYATERQRLVDAGLISKELGDVLAEKYPWYNPLRYLDYVDAQAAVGKRVKPLSVSSSGLQRLSEIGSEAAIRDPMSTLAEELVRNEVRIRKNELAKGIVNLGMEDTTLGIAKRKISVPVAQVEGEVIYRPQHGEIPGTLSYFENGKRQVFDVPDWMYREAAVLNQTINSPVASLIGALNGISRAAFTTFSPAFTVANLMNDMLPALVRGGVLPTTTARRLILSFKPLEADRLMQAYRLSGAMQARFYGQDATQIAKQVGASGGKVIGKTFNLKKAVFDAIPDLGQKGEQATRQAVFERNLNKTLPKWKEMTAEQIAVTPQARKAAADAVEATINFGRGGYLVRSANPFVIFLNASMEGTKLPFRTLRDSARSRWTLAGIGAGIGGLVAYNMSYPEYFDVPDRVRWGSVMIMLPSTKNDMEGKSVPKYLTIIPNTREWAMFFAPLTYGMEKAFKDNPQDFGQFARAMIPQVSPVGSLPMPQVLSEAVEQLSNYDFYRGAPIVGQGKVNLPSTEQTSPYVSSSVERGAQATGLSPLRVQHVLQSLFGGAGQAALSVLDLAFGAKNKRGLELKAEYDAMSGKRQTTWMNKLSSSDRAALISTINQLESRNVPVVSPVAARFYHERGGQITENDWNRFNQITSDTNRTFSDITDMKKLGIRLGEAGDSIVNVQLTPGQRADYQRIMANIVIPGMIQFAEETKSMPSDERKTLAVKRMGQLKDQARILFADQVGIEMARQGGTATPSSRSLPSLGSLGTRRRSSLIPSRTTQRRSVLMPVRR